MATWDGLLGNLGNFLMGQQEGVQQLPRYSSENQGSFDDFIGSILSRFNQGSNFSEGFEPFANKAVSDFHSKTVPSIAERFTRMGGTRSGGFANALGEAGAGMQTDLAAQGAQFGQNQQQLLMRMLGLGQQESVFRPETHGFLGNVANFGAEGFGKGLGTALGGGVSSLAGQGVGMAGQGMSKLAQLLGLMKKK